MAEARCRDEWGRASALMALLANVNRDAKKGRAFRPSDFDPYTEKDGRRGAIVVDKENIGLLKQAFATGAAKEGGEPRSAKT